MTFRPLLTLCALIFISALNASCVTMSESDCRSGDWRAFGAADAMQDRVSETQPARVKSCQERGIRPDLASYALGVKDGQKAYCTPKNGWAIGTHGGSYNNSCPKETEGPTVRAMSLAQEIYTAQAQADQAQRERENRREFGGFGGLGGFGLFGNPQQLQRRADEIYARNVAEYVRLFGAYPDQ